MFIYLSREIGKDPQVTTAANIFKKFCYDYRDSLSAGIICAGWDEYNRGQVLYVNCHKKCYFYYFICINC